MEWYLNRWWGRLLGIVALFDWVSILVFRFEDESKMPFFLQAISALVPATDIFFVDFFVSIIFGLGYLLAGVMGLLFIVFAIKDPAKFANDLARYNEEG